MSRFFQNTPITSGATAAPDMTIYDYGGLDFGYSNPMMKAGIAVCDINR
ncbi:MAG: hypothetical protein JRH15_06880 [Deltaproteobacteria bacterium]|nr:hypothetical protein [Deltaproteobacteria bacterium]